jgi:hypothetical protein
MPDSVAELRKSLKNAVERSKVLESLSIVSMLTDCIIDQNFKLSE